MGILDKLKGLMKGREDQVKGGIDKVSDTLEKKVPDHADKIDGVSDKAKDAVDKLSGEPDAAAPATSTTPAPKPPPPAVHAAHSDATGTLTPDAMKGSRPVGGTPSSRSGVSCPSACP